MTDDLRYCLNQLSPKQRIVAMLIAEGYTDLQIQGELVMPEGTLRYHLGQICARFNLDHNRNLRVQIARLVAKSA